ncbi:MAG: Mut7-C RNAse domain-containing protein [Lentisphaeria bacterium]|nr:Mut7-C RNAse domain-containing protein [Lentisphaeria bacterium]
MSYSLRFYEELNDFLPPERRKRSFEIPYGEPRSVKDLIEALGVPHTEVDLILVNGESVDFSCKLCDGDRISVYPVFEGMDISPVCRLREKPLRHPRFVADVHLGKLVRYLRLLGFDCLYDSAWNDPELADISVRDRRVLLTRDRLLLMRSVITHGVYIHSDRPLDQLIQVIRRLDLKSMIRPLARCMTCNGCLIRVEKASVENDVPTRTFRYVDDYRRCVNCQKVYWKGTHWERLQNIIEMAMTDT